MLNSPIKWVGGKSRLRKHIIALLPEHTCYVEPFGGAAWVLFGKPPSPVEVLNDIDQDLINFFRIIKTQPQDFIESFDWALVSRAEFERLAQQDPTHLSPLERAHRFYYLIMAGWGGEFRYPRFQISIQDGGHGNRLIGALKHLRERIEPIYQRLQTVIIENLDWQTCLDKYDRPGTVMYIDPPYPNNGANYAHNMRDLATHQQLADRLHTTRCQWIVSSYDRPETYSLFGDYTILPVEAASGMRVKKDNTQRVTNREVLITSFSPKTSAPFITNQYQLSLEPEQEQKD